jgi:voltage-gated potassium channel
VLPFYLPFFIPFDLRFLRVLRLLRIFQVLKIVRYSSAIRMLGRVIKRESEIIFIIVFILAILLILASSLMYAVEKAAQPEVFSSIPAAMWLAVVTLTTVGYGDVCPVTPLGKIVGGCIAILGIGMFALPAGVLASGFAEEIQKERNNKTTPQPDDTLDRLERLQRLREQGALTEDEFAGQKEQILRIE